MGGPSAAFLTHVEGTLYHLALRVIPGARKSGVIAPVFLSDSAISIRIAAPPVEGKANEVVVEFLEEKLTQELKHYLADPSIYRMDSGVPDGNLENTCSKYEEKKSFAASVQSKKKSAPHTSHTKVSKLDGKYLSKNISHPKNELEGDVRKNQTLLPQTSRVAVSLVKGYSARNKVVAIDFPGSEEYLLMMLRKIFS